MRPDFSPELEYERRTPPTLGLEFGQRGGRQEIVKPSSKLFSIFRRKENPPKDVSKCPEKAKIKKKVSKNLKKLPSSRIESLTTNTSKPDIRNYFNRSENKAVTAVQKMKTDSCQQLGELITHEPKQNKGWAGESRTNYRDRESDITWDPRLYKEGAED